MKKALLHIAAFFAGVIANILGYAITMLLNLLISWLSRFSHYGDDPFMSPLIVNFSATFISSMFTYQIVELIAPSKPIVHTMLVLSCALVGNVMAKSWWDIAWVVISAFIVVMIFKDDNK